MLFTSCLPSVLGIPVDVSVHSLQKVSCPVLGASHALSFGRRWLFIEGLQMCLGPGLYLFKLFVLLCPYLRAHGLGIIVFNLVA